MTLFTKKTSNQIDQEANINKEEKIPLARKTLTDPFNITQKRSPSIGEYISRNSNSVKNLTTQNALYKSNQRKYQNGLTTPTLLEDKLTQKIMGIDTN